MLTYKTVVRFRNLLLNRLLIRLESDPRVDRS